jgi:serine O-acetyltransferase
MATDTRLKENLPSITEQLVETYKTVGTINHLGHCPLPSYDVVIEIINDLTEIIFPGYRRREGLHIANVTYYVGDLIDSLHDKLTKQIARALLHECDRMGPVDEDAIDFEAVAQLKTVEFLQQLPALREILSSDVQAAYAGDPAVSCIDEIIFCYPGLEAISIYRLAHILYQLDVPYIPRMMTEYAHHRTGIDIHPGATIGRSFFIDHGTGVVVGQTCEIGEHVKLYQGVTLGALSFPTDSDGQLIRGDKRHPTIEDKVVVYANATILGGKTTIGARSVIGSSVWLTRSVKPDSTVTLERPKLRVREEDNGDDLAMMDFQI